MRIFEGEYLQDREKASCGCIFLKESICKIEKRQVADANLFEGEYLQAEKKQVADVYSCKLIEKSICKSS